MSRIEISDGSSWPRPALEADAEYGIGHKLRYKPMDKITREDLLQAASVIDAYGYLIAESTQAQRDIVCREVRAALKAEERLADDR